MPPIINGLRELEEKGHISDVFENNNNNPQNPKGNPMYTNKRLKLIKEEERHEPKVIVTQEKKSAKSLQEPSV